MDKETEAKLMEQAVDAETGEPVTPVPPTWDTAMHNAKQAALGLQLCFSGDPRMSIERGNQLLATARLWLDIATECRAREVR